MDIVDSSCKPVPTTNNEDNVPSVSGGYGHCEEHVHLASSMADASSDTQTDRCYHCDGYYGPSNGDPLCEICHDFLYVEHFDISLSQQNWAYGISQTQTEKDDGDSGNDEPSEDAPPILISARSSDPVENDCNIILPTASGASSTMPNPLVSHGTQRPGSSSKASQSPLAPRSPPHNPSFDDSPLEEMYMLPLTLAESREQERISRRLTLLTTPLPTYQMIPESDLTLKLPPEIWRMVFRKLDPVTLLLASRASLRWKSIILELVPNESWKFFVMEKWPLFSPIYEVIDWYSVFVSFLQSLSCYSCWIKMSSPSTFLPAIGDEVMAFRSLRSVRLSKELKWLMSDHPDGIEALPLDHLNYNWLARIIGPPQSPYQGGVFYLNIKIPHDYPLKPPLVRFLTKVYHPNISRHGDIGIDCIQHNWTLALFIPQTLLSIQSLLTDPCEPCMEPAIGKLRHQDRKAFERRATIWTWRYAMTDVLLT